MIPPFDVQKIRDPLTPSIGKGKLKNLRRSALQPPENLARIEIRTLEPLISRLSTG